MKHKEDLLIQFHALIVLVVCWPVGADEVVKSDDEMKRLTSDVNSLEGEPPHSSACSNDITSLNIARQQEPAEPLFKFWCLELQMKQIVKSTICEPNTLFGYRNNLSGTTI